MTRMMTPADPIEVLRRRTSEKWTAHPEDVLPLFVAEMDYGLAPAIKAALREAIDAGDTGYINPHDTRAAAAFSDFAADAWDWSPPPDRMAYTTDVSVVIVESLRRLISPGDGVVITPPVYPPFFDLIPEAGGTVVEVPLLDEADAYHLDVDGIDRALAAGARAVLLCNPHNPVGLVHDRATLTRLSRVVARHGAFVVSDEIHAPLTHAGTRFTPYLSVSDEAREHGIAAESGSKAFNLAGLKTAMFAAESEPMAELIRSLPEEVASTVAAIESNVALLDGQLAEKLPAVRWRRPDASYLAWLDLRGLGWGADPAAYALERARVALVSGLDFGTQGAGFARMNLACAPGMVIEAVDRIAAAAHSGSR